MKYLIQVFDTGAGHRAIAMDEDGNRGSGRGAFSRAAAIRRAISDLDELRESLKKEPRKERLVKEDWERFKEPISAIGEEQ